MSAKRKQIMVLPIALVIGSGIFAAGHSMRPKTAATQVASVTLEQTSAAAEAPPSVAAPIVVSRASMIPVEALLASAAESASDQPQPQVRTGVVISMNGVLFVLRDDNNNTWYHLDDQKSAAPFLGKKVRVMGEFDPSTDTIHVKSIEEEKS